MTDASFAMIFVVRLVRNAFGMSSKHDVGSFLKHGNNEITNITQSPCAERERENGLSFINIECMTAHRESVMRL